jgi:large subunit ribosomal protein L15
MQIHELKRKNPNKKPIKVGRGGKRGKTSGKGTKGQNARSGSSRRPEIRDMIKKIPKLRGRGVNINKSFQQKSQPISLSILDKNFKDGEKVTPNNLFEKNLVKKEMGKLPLVKILATGELTKKLIISKCSVSKKAQDSIEKAGGKIV